MVESWEFLGGFTPGALFPGFESARRLASAGPIPQDNPERVRSSTRVSWPHVVPFGAYPLASRPLDERLIINPQHRSWRQGNRLSGPISMDDAAGRSLPAERLLHKTVRQRGNSRRKSEESQARRAVDATMTSEGTSDRVRRDG